MSRPFEKQNLPSCPYPGIDPFTYGGRGVFFAREAEARSLIHLVVMFRGVLLYAGSTIGKSSLVDAGLIPLAIEEGFQPSRIRVQPKQAEEIIVERIAGTADGEPGFLPSIFEPGGTQERVVLSVEDFLAAVRKGAAARPLLIFDQFEEWVTLFEEAAGGQAGREARAIQERICEAIASLINEASLPVKVLMVFREDYLAQLAPYFKRCPSLPDQHLQLRPLIGSQIYRAIRGPFEDYPGVYRPEISPDLAKTIQAQFEDRSGGSDISLPEVQIVCQGLFQAGGRGEKLEQFFDEQGGVRGILEKYLEGRLASLPDDQHDAAVGLLSRMVTSAGTRNVISEEDILQRVENEDGISPALLRPALIGLEDTRLVHRERRRDVYYYEIASEFLVEWIRAKAQQRERLAEQRKLAEARAEALEQKQRAEQQAEIARRMRRRAMGLAALFALFLVAALVAFLLHLRTHSLDLLVNSQRLAATAISNLDRDPELSILLGMYALQAQATPEALDALNRSLNASRLERKLVGHTDKVTQVAFSPKGDLLATGSQDKTVRIWDANSGGLLQTLKHDGPVLGLAFSQDGKLVVTASEGKKLQIWDVSTGNPLRALSDVRLLDQDEVSGIAFSPDGNIAVSSYKRDPATGHYQSRIWIWKAVTGEALRDWDGETEIVKGLAFSIHGGALATAGSNGSVKVWQTATGKRTLDIEGHTGHGHTDQVMGVAFSPSGQYLASAGMDRTVRVWNAHGENLATLTAHTNTVFAVAFDKDGRLASASADGRVKVWDPLSGRELLNLPAHTNPIEGVAFSPDGSRLASASWDKSVRIWRADTHVGGITDVAFSPDGTQVATASRDHTVKLWDADLRRELRTFVGHPAELRAVAFSKDGIRMASCDEGGFTFIWDVATGKALHRLPAVYNCLGQQPCACNNVAFSPDGKVVASVGDDWRATMWDADSEQHRIFEGHNGAVSGVSFSPDGQVLATSSADKTVRLWRVASGEKCPELHGHESDVFFVKFSPNGEYLASGGIDTKVKLWKTALGNECKETTEWSTLIGHTNMVSAGMFSPDSQLLATASADRTVRIWDVKSGREERSFLHSNEVNGVVFSPDAKHLHLVTGSEDTVPHLYILDTAELMGRARQRITQVGRVMSASECIKYLHQDSCPALP